MIRIGAGAGFADDRIEPAVDLAERGDLDYLVFECLAERSIALAQLERRRDPDAGWNEWLDERMDAVLEPAVRHGTTIITNMGAANPFGAARQVAQRAAALGLRGLRIAAIIGDDVLDLVQGTDLSLLERSGTLSSLDGIISANAYLGMDGILDALAADVDVIVAGRVADPSLFLAPLVHEFGWARDDWARLGAGTAVGHLLECAGQVTGGYYADPGVKDVPDLARLGFPFAEVCADGSFVVTKLPGTGGRVTVSTVTEQLLYEVHDPARYITPDVVADFSAVELAQVGEDRVAVSGASGTARPATLKVSVGYVDSFVGEGQISYAGPNAVARGRLALTVVRERLARGGVPVLDARYELIGVDSIHPGGGGDVPPGPGEVRARVAVRTPDLASARRVGHEVAALWLNGPAGGGGVYRAVTEDVTIVSVFLPRDDVLVRTFLMGDVE
ncbi:acyclic terpene utilization AtuA family protein [Parafrankia sp. FMc2]|uniref:acyclic terpene utilization AtuA family protein n=1 Tax=Parafrankia sp. FMc2 TaxID=3233196 RepID=UPI0034D4A578